MDTRIFVGRRTLGLVKCKITTGISIWLFLAISGIIIASVTGGRPRLGRDCYDIWANCLQDVQAAWQFEHEDEETGDLPEETELDTLMMHYECVNATVAERRSCIDELTDGVCNVVDRQIAQEMGSHVLKDLELYCKNWELQLDGE